MLKIRGLESCYGESCIVSGLTLDVPKGEIVGLIGRNGVGKSTTLKSIMGLVKTPHGAIELVKRGHRLIADDAVEIKRVSDKTLVGTAPEVIRHFIELRGIGIVTFAVSSVSARSR